MQKEKTPGILDSTVYKHRILSLAGNVDVKKLISARYIGLLESEITTATACLLEDGRVLTVLHAICDLETEQFILPTEITVTFVFNGQAYTYIVADVVNHGLSALKAGASQFDYATLILKGNPCADLGGGLKLDMTDHFGGMSGGQEPQQTLAISAPIFGYDEEGLIPMVTQYVSVSQVQNNNNYFSFHQEATHPTAPGFSGQAILRMDSGELYALHRGRESSHNTGIKICEYLASVQSNYTIDNYKSRFLKEAILNQLKLEKLRHGGTDASDIEKFLDVLAVAIKNQQTIPHEKIPLSLIQYPIVDGHQAQHLLGREYKGEAYFFDWLVKSEQNPIINALINVATKLASDYYQYHLKISIEDWRKQNQVHFNFSKCNKVFMLSKKIKKQLYPEGSIVLYERQTDFIVEIYLDPKNIFQWSMTKRECAQMLLPKVGEYSESQPLISQIIMICEKDLTRKANTKLRQETKFVIDLGVDVGIDVKSKNTPTSCVLLDGFGGKVCHIYPVVPDRVRGGIKPTVINARKLIEEAKNREIEQPQVFVPKKKNQKNFIN